MKSIDQNPTNINRIDKYFKGYFLKFNFENYTIKNYLSFDHNLFKRNFGIVYDVSYLVR